MHKWDWFYERSPTGEPLVYLLEVIELLHGEHIRSVGSATMGHRSFRVGDKDLSGLVLVDMVVTQQHRTLFPALFLQKAILAAGLDEAAFLYGFPNPRAVPVIQRAGYRKIGAAVRHVRVLYSAEYLRAYLPGWLAKLSGQVLDYVVRQWLGMQNIGASKLSLRWQNMSEAACVGSVDRISDRPLLQGARAIEFLGWRFESDGSREYSFVSVFEEAGGSFVGYWIVEGVNGVLHVQDCAAALLVDAAPRRAWMMLFDEARRRGYYSVSFECLAPDEFVQTLRRNGMRPRNERPVFGIARDDHEWIMTAAWYLTAADEDE